jgi:C4-dicarboxylate-specific signal transduction histidine kinase
MLIASVILIQSALIAGLWYEHRRRRQAEMLSFQRMSELAHLNRLATAGELSASIAHEVKQPLTAMVTLSSAALRWLSQKTPNLTEVKSALEKICVAGDRAGQIVDDLRKMFRRETDAHNPVSVNTVVENVLALTTHELQKNNVSVRKSLSELAPNVLGDQAQLEQVLLNLVVNAIEAMGSSGSSTRALRIETSASEADGVLIAVKDSGPGLDAKSLDKIFDAFYTTKQSGMGMGLSICRSIVESHGGRLWATRADRGLTFFVSLPAING